MAETGAPSKARLKYTLLVMLGFAWPMASSLVGVYTRDDEVGS
jgi:hypothetical protein